MSFIKEYSHAEIIINYSETFLESNEHVTYSVGYNGNGPTILKTDFKGDTLWQTDFDFDFPDPKTFQFNKIIQIIETNGSISYVLQLNNNSLYALAKIDSRSAIEWIKVVVNIAPFDNQTFLVNSKVSADFYFCFSVKNPEFSALYYMPHIMRFGTDGTVINAILQRTTSADDLLINAVYSYEHGLTVLATHKASMPNILDYEHDLTLKQHLDLFYGQMPYSDFTVNDIIVYPADENDNTYIISGYDVNSDVAALLKVTPQQSPKIHHLSNSTGMTVTLCKRSNDFYAVGYQSAGTNPLSSIYYFKNIPSGNLDFTLLWTKRVGATNSYLFKRLNYLIYSETLTGFDIHGKYLLYSAPDLITCKTSNISGSISKFDPVIIDDRGDTMQEDVSFSITNDTCEKDIDSESDPGEFICSPFHEYIDISSIENTSLQSPNLVFCAAGSNGDDGSAVGIHLRWMFAGSLGEMHIPKGSYSQNSWNFNKPDDFVTVYRAKYQKFQTELDLNNEPHAAYNQIGMWTYNIDGKFIYIYFRNLTKYHEVLANHSTENPLEFIENYGNELIEIVCKRDLFFNARIYVSGSGSSSSLQTEAISVPENIETAQKFTYARKTFSGGNLSTAELFCENGRSIRIRATACFLSKIKLEFYSDFIEGANDAQIWQKIGDFALSTDDETALTALEPLPGLIHGKWPFFNDGDRVNIANYKDKWDSNVGNPDQSLKALVQRYLELSELEDNPQAIDPVLPEDPEDEEDPEFDMSLLSMINLGANDYHIARLLGLGTIDHFSSSNGTRYVYLTRYTTLKNVNNIENELEVNHIAMSLPLLTTDQRLPKPVEIDELEKGITDPDRLYTITDPEGYSFDGKYRYITVTNKPVPEIPAGQAFYNTSDQYNMKDFSYPVYGGLEYRKAPDTEWEKPETSHDSEYRYAVSGQLGHFEAQPIIIPESSNKFYIHKQTKSGTYFYNSYGINIFSRSTSSLLEDLSITTELKPANILLPPSNINTVNIAEESPLMFTSADEQTLLTGLLEDTETPDKTLIRLTFDYNYIQEASVYKIDPEFTDAEALDPEGFYPDSLEIYADEIEIYFRNHIPNTVSGKATFLGNIGDDVSEIGTSPYVLTSINETLTPIIPAGTADNYKGGLLIVGDQQYVIKEIDTTQQYPKIQVYKKQISDSLLNPSEDYTDLDDIQDPAAINGALFTMVENMQNLYCWGTGNPHTIQVELGWPSSPTKKEIYESLDDDGNTDRYLEKSRGFWETGNIETVMEPTDEADTEGNPVMAHLGLYKITFDGFHLEDHPQIEQNINWYRGVVRVKTNTAVTDNNERKICEIVKIENIGTSEDLVIYFNDLLFEDEAGYDKIYTGEQDINFYPGYRVYLYQNSAIGLTAPNVQPGPEEDVKYSIFGLRSHSLNSFQPGGYFSKMSTPSLLFVQKDIAPQAPLPSIGALYATRPDFYGKSTYTFETEFLQRPYAAIFYRANDEALLGALYSQATLLSINTSLDALGGYDETDLGNRWDNFLDFDSLTDAYGTYSGYQMPLPDNPDFIESITDFVIWHNAHNGTNTDVILPITFDTLDKVIIGQASGVESDVTFLDFIRETVENLFVPLTELPLIYQYIKPYPYEPIAKKQQVRDRNGHLLNPLSPDFDMAPMAKIVGENKVSFTDFTLDGASRNIYFYGAREMGNKMKIGPFGKFSKPVKLVNTYPAYAPEIRKIISLLEPAPGELPSIVFEMNEYDKRQGMEEINLYRAFNRLDSQSVRSMELVHTYIINSDEVQVSDGVWSFQDDFSDLADTPYGETAYYRITVSRKVEYTVDDILMTEYAPSLPSKIYAFVLPEPVWVVSPVLYYNHGEIEDAVIHDVTLFWNKTIYNGIYHLYKMNAQGNWNEIFSIQTNGPVVYVNLGTISGFTSNLNLLDILGRQINHHFKVIAESPAGKISKEENILTIYENDIVPGIGEMGIDKTFMVRPNNN
jgi:hypothetical protein